MERKFIFLAMVLLLSGALVSACGEGIPVSGDRGGISPLQSAATQSVLLTQDAQFAATQNALETEVVRLRAQVAQQTAVSGQSATAAPALPTEIPSSSPVPTATLPPPTPAPTVTTQPCNLALFIADVTIPDRTVLAPGANFTKIWRLQNLGSCSWTTDYALVFVGGDAMNGPAGIAMPGNVLPGQIIDLSVDLVAPTQAGSYRGDWKLRDASGVLFGLGRKGSAFYVDIQVNTSESAGSLNFTVNYCQAVWTSGAGLLPCPGTTDDSRGYVRRIDKPTLESGYIDDEPALLTYPQMITDGVIRGKYPSIRVEPGYHFAAVIGCVYRAEECDVNFQLDYQIGDGSIQTLASWHEWYDGEFHLVDVDLDSLAGEEVNFILTVFANGAANQDRALWLAPHISKR